MLGVVLLFGGKEVFGAEKVHFLNVYGDAVIVESNGHYGMIDGGEDSDNPTNNPTLEWLPGGEEKVLSYIHQNLVPQEDGKIHFDFIIGTHSHSDHIGGLRYAVKDDQVVVDKAFLKPYDNEKQNDTNKAWDNLEERKLLIAALEEKNIPYYETLEELQNYNQFQFGSSIIQLFNLFSLSNLYGDIIYGENDNSLVAVMNSQGKRVFFGADLTIAPNMVHPTGTEKEIAEEVGAVTAVKLNHHGNPGSNEEDFFNYLKPRYAIKTPSGDKISSKTLKEIVERKIFLYDVKENDGLVLDLTQEDLGLSQYLPVNAIQIEKDEEEIYTSKGWLRDGTNWYYLTGDGMYLKGFHQIAGDAYFFNEAGLMQTGWYRDSNGTWFFLDPTGRMQRGWQKIGSHQYYFNENGELVLGWIEKDNQRFYVKGNGTLATNWEQIDGIYYYFSTRNQMLTGWQKIKGKWYLLQPDGKMKVGWYQDEIKRWFHLSKTGAMTIGWYNDGKNWYYLNKNGAMQIGWYQDEHKNWYYFDSTGRMATKRVTIGKRNYNFKINGVWMEGKR